MTFLDKLVTLFNIYWAEVNYYDKLAGNEKAGEQKAPTCTALRFREFQYSTYF
jgi:hypothetical protein